MYDLEGSNDRDVDPQGGPGSYYQEEAEVHLGAD